MSDAGPEEWFEELALVRARVDARLADVGRVLAVMSGKGGVGKTAVASNLALALGARGLRVGLLDADLNSPTVAKVLGLRGQPLRMVDTDLLPQPGPLGIAVQSMDFFLQGTQPLDWEGEAGEGAHVRSALEDAALADLLGQTRWGELDVLLVDLAPGADRLPALARLSTRIDGALAVTLPTEVSLLAVERSARRVLAARVPLLGLVENMASVVCPHCGREHALFLEASAERLARELDVPLLARIPFDARLAAAADAGRPFLPGPAAPGSKASDASDGPSPAAAAFAKLGEEVASWEPAREPISEPSEHGSDPCR